MKVGFTTRIIACRNHSTAVMVVALVEGAMDREGWPFLPIISPCFSAVFSLTFQEKVMST